ncbi:MAG: transglycosylase domain-containing protein [Gemmatimonadota bacterium]
MHRARSLAGAVYVTTMVRRLRELGSELGSLLSTPWGRRVGHAALVVGFVVLSVAVVSRIFTVSCPKDTACVTLDELVAGAPLPEAIELVDRHGETLAEIAGPLRRSLESEQIPELVRDAFVAVEDRRFREHGGVDARGVLRAAIRNLRAGGVEEGASTIPMQLVRTLWSESLRDVGPWRRKTIEALTAPRMIDRLGHERVLTLYLNAIYMGNGIYGIERAARHYFDKGVADLGLAELATLVGMTQGPERFEPRRHPERTRDRRDLVLAILTLEGLVTLEEAEAAREAPLETTPEPELLRRRTYMSAAVTRELRAVAPDLAGTQALRVVTTVDPVIQREGERALSAQLDGIEGGAWGRYAVTDSTVRLQGAAVALDPYSGAVRAWIGGRDFAYSEFDRVDQARRQVGSLIKPFLVASAIERGIGILALVSADTVPIQSASGPWLPADHVDETILPLREALVRSSNRAAAHLAMDIGLDAVRTVGQSVGITSPIPVVPSSSIGAFDASLLEMTGAYAVFGNGGRVVEPHLIERIETKTGTVLWEREIPEADIFALGRTTSFVVLDAMRDVVDRGTGFAVRAQGYFGPAAGKTGTTNEGRDAWFIGLTPDLVSGIWIGLDQPGHIVREAGGGTLAAPAWAHWMRGLERAGARSSASWLPPVGVQQVRYDPVNGQALGQGCMPRSGAQPEEAWVHTGSVQFDDCRGGVLGWLERVWHSIAPPAVKPIEPTRIRPRGGR